MIYRHGLRNALLPLDHRPGPQHPCDAFRARSPSSWSSTARASARLLIGAIAERDYARHPGRRRGLRVVRGADQPADGPALHRRRSTHSGEMMSMIAGNCERHRARCRARKAPAPGFAALLKRSCSASLRRIFALAIVGDLRRRRRPRAVARALRPADAERVCNINKHPSARALARHRPVRPRRALAHDLRLAQLADLRPDLAGARGPLRHHARRHRRLFRRHRRPGDQPGHRPAARLPGAAARDHDRGGAGRRLLEHRRGHHRRLRSRLCPRRAGLDAGGQAGALCRGRDRGRACARR